jgi:hypothetical protein
MSLAHVRPNRMTANFLIVSNLPFSGHVRTWGPMQCRGQPHALPLSRQHVGLFREGHPKPVAARIVRLARLVGRENVIAETDCGFSPGPFQRRFYPSIMWAKLEALVAGAELASKELWGNGAPCA